MGPTTKLPSLGHIEFDAMRDSYKVQVKGLVDGGVDLLIVETCQDLLQTKAALAAIQEFCEESGTRNCGHCFNHDRDDGNDVDGDGNLRRSHDNRAL